MIKSGLLNPAVLQLLARVRHTNTLVIADRGFPFWPQIETVDISLVDDLPTVLQVLDAIRANFVIGRAYAATEFKTHNTAASHVLKYRGKGAIGLIRTGGTVPYSNLVIESA